MDGMIAGFTGTRAGMTSAQADTVLALVTDLPFVRALHGGCYNADTQFHDICIEVGIPRITVYPSDMLDSWGRDWPKVTQDVRPPRRPLDRNRVIANKCDVLIVAPKQYAEVRGRAGGGTWATYRYGRAAGKDVIVVTPDGRT